MGFPASAAAALWHAGSGHQSPEETLSPDSPTGKTHTEGCRVQACWAKTADDVRAAQRLRYEVFAGELGATLNTVLAGHDIDVFDDYCEHLLVRDAKTQQVVGTYRLLPPAQARQLGSSYCNDAFDLAALAALRPRMVELGRSCVRPGYRQGSVILSLWTALADFMLRHGMDTMIGCASLPPGKGQAASIWRNLRRTHLASARYRVQPRLPFPVETIDGVDSFDDQVCTDPPALVRGYLRLGATVLGPPAWDPAFKTADLLMMMRTADLPARYLRSVQGG